MKIEKTNSPSTLEHNQKGVLLPSIIDRIFLISRDNKNFPIREKIESLDRGLIELKRKHLKQTSILENAENLKDSLIKKVGSLEEENISTREELLEALGSEL